MKDADLGALPLDQVIEGDCLEVLPRLPAKSVDLIFADPPYNLQLSQRLWRPNMTRVDAVDDQWDKFDSFQAYDAFTRQWLEESRRVLKDSGTLWVIGTYHNIFRIGTILQDLGYWVLNDIVWVKTNPMPNFRGVRFTNAHETLVWATKFRGAKYTFNYQAMKQFNRGKQMRSDWVLPICSGNERIRQKGQKAHSTQKPEGLLYRVLLAATNPGDVVLDPFFGTGTTGVVAKRLHRHWIGVEKERRYVRVARRRLDTSRQEPYSQSLFDVRDHRQPDVRVPFLSLLEEGRLLPGQALYFRRVLESEARIRPDGTIACRGIEGSIHEVGRFLMDGSPCNGWQHWYYRGEDGELYPIDNLRKQLRLEWGAGEGDENSGTP